MFRGEKVLKLLITLLMLKIKRVLRQHVLGNPESNPKPTNIRRRKSEKQTNVIEKMKV